MISKHDIALSGKRNASKVMNFPPEFETGDGHGINMSLSNSVFNTLKVHSMHESKRSGRLHDKTEKSTTELAIDSKTRLILYKLVNNDILESIGGVISTGKEAVILYAPGGKSKDVLMPAECVAKVYKTTLNEFKTRSKYIKDDYRFKDRYKHLNPRKIVRLWAEKEMHNLMKMRNFGILCPEVVTLKKNVLLMSFIGSEAQPAPKLKDVNLNEEQLKDAYQQIIQVNN
jgi:RIO kinase 3